MDVCQANLYTAIMIGSRLKVARSAKKLSLREIGEAMEVTPQAVAQWEKGKPRFSIDKLHRLANVLDVSVDWLRGTQGVDDVVEKSKMYNALNGRVPIISIHHSILIAPFAKTDFDSIPYKETLEPSARIVGQGYAIRMKGNNKFLNIRKGDILILDNAVTAKDLDIVLGIEIFENTIRTVIASVVTEDDMAEAMKKLIGESDTEQEDEGDYEEFLSKTGSLKPIAVVVEHRRLWGGGADSEEF